MAPSIIREEYLISGLQVWTFSHPAATNSTKPVQIDFVLHPRLQSQASYEERVRRILELIYETQDLQFDVVLVTFVGISRAFRINSESPLPG